MKWTPIQSGRLASGGFIAAAWQLDDQGEFAPVRHPVAMFGCEGVNARAPTEGAAIAECKRRMAA